MVELAVGDPAPDFDLPSHQGGRVRLSSFRGKSSVLVYFYPKDKTSVCTVEACTFRDHLPEIQNRGGVVLGISMDPVSLHQEFAAEQRLNFPLLSDVDGRVAGAYGVLGDKDGEKFVRRDTFLVDTDGVIREIVRLRSRGDRDAYLKAVTDHVSSLAGLLA